MLLPFSLIKVHIGTYEHHSMEDDQNTSSILLKFSITSPCPIHHNMLYYPQQHYGENREPTNAILHLSKRSQRKRQ
jgi:hypothetical protein